MNKGIVLNILSELIIKYQNNELNEDTYNKILKNPKFCSITNNISSYKETSLLALLFKNIPYYQMFPFLISFISYLQSISTNEKTKFISNLIEGIFCELTISLTNRTITETNAHLYKLAQIFYIESHLSYQKTINLLIRNTLLPEQLVGLDIAENARFEQETIPTFIDNPENLRENISKKNHNLKTSIERKLIALLTKFFTPLSLSNFENELTAILSEYRIENPKEADLLQDTLFEQLKLIKKEINQNWQKQTKQVPDNLEQLTIFSLTKKA